ncbi:hypothetical protein GZL_03627 [Streptomyces sp. 769]|nr:hypothetical protein GZL_03627 [Streptomyces sp. 769]
MSGAGQFTVDVEELGSLATRLDHCKESMKHAGGDLRSATTGDLTPRITPRAQLGIRPTAMGGISSVAR